MSFITSQEKVPSVLTNVNVLGIKENLYISIYNLGKLPMETLDQ